MSAIKNRWHPLFFCFLLFPLLSFSQSFDFNENCRVAYNEIFSLRLEKGIQLIASERREHPGNLIPALLDNYIDFLNIITTEDEHLLPAFKTAKSRREDALRKGDESSPWFRHALAETHLQYALAALLFREYFSGLLEFRKAYALIRENAAKYPGFQPGLKNYYMLQALLGVIPEKYNWALRLFGMNGNLKAGLEGLRKLSEADWGDNAFLRDEAGLTYAMLLLHLEGDRKKAWGAVHGKYPLEGNLFSYYVAIKIAVYSGHNDDALELLENFPEGKDYAPMPVMEYYNGLAHLQRLDTAAIHHFQKFLAETRGKDLLKSAYHKIAWAYWISGNSAGYHENMKRVKEHGVAQNDLDKQAEREAESAMVPHAELLKARLLFDGGYFEKALSVLDRIQPESLHEKQYQLELAYRQARIFDETGDTVRAIERYMRTLSNGGNEPYYYAANAALHLGMIYEARDNKELARNYYNECISLQNHEYKVSLTQKAKAGLDRLK